MDFLVDYSTAVFRMMDIRDLLRHRSVQMTERYAHLAPHNVRRAVSVLDRVGHIPVTSEVEEDEK
jgi:integrase